MSFPILLLGAVAVFWIAGEIQPLGETLVTWVAYGLSFYLVVLGFLKATASISGEDE